jgi:hypothetical protein
MACVMDTGRSGGNPMAGAMMRGGAFLDFAGHRP